MAIFALPLSTSNGQIATSHSTPTTKSHSIGRKRRRDPSPSIQPSGSQTPALNDPCSSPAPSAISAHIANPLALNDEDRAQYIAAGLPLDTELPSKTYTQFPHRQLPDDAIIDDGGWTTAGETETEGGRKRRRDAEGRTGRRSHMRVRHLGVLTAIVQRCLMEGDIPRATKAFNLLLRAQVGGRGVDLRTANYWGVGAELLIRAGELRPIGKKPLASVKSTHDAQEVPDETDGAVTSGERRWGTKAGIQQAKQYYERLILQHPYMRQFSSSSLSSLDFWPAMIGIEIYGVQYEYNSALSNLSTTSFDEDDEGYHSPLREDMTEEEEARSERRREKRIAARKAERVWAAKEAVRTRAQNAAKDIQKRLDELMTGPPWTDSGVMLRLRACVCLWVGDLCLPTPFDERADGDADDTIDEDVDGERAARRREEESERAQRAVSRRYAVENAKQERKAQYELARIGFVQARKRGMDAPDVDWEEVLGEEEASF